jgi:hypothetical protein
LAKIQMSTSRNWPVIATVRFSKNRKRKQKLGINRQNLCEKYGFLCLAKFCILETRHLSLYTANEAKKRSKACFDKIGGKREKQWMSKKAEYIYSTLKRGFCCLSAVEAQKPEARLFFSPFNSVYVYHCLCISFIYNWLNYHQLQ